MADELLPAGQVAVEATSVDLFDHFELIGKRRSVQAQLGNSVPPLLAQRVIEQVALTQS